jgi:large subunit ribosomal protein L30
MGKIRITQIRSTIKRPEVQKRIIKSLGLGKINRSVEKEQNDALDGAIRKVSHLVKIENI